jgi:putative endonuclease
LFINRGFVYILASKRDSVLYTGVTSDIVKRVYEHKQGFVEGFSKKYNTKLLVYYECHDRIDDAVHRETCIKRWKREWKIKLIEDMNPDWQDLYESIAA